jgi:hypothetical protein
MTILAVAMISFSAGYVIALALAVEAWVLPFKSYEPDEDE